MLMMSLGPVPLPAALVFFVIVLMALLARVWPGRASLQRRAAAHLLMDMAVLGVVIARLAFMVHHAGDYLAAPWSMLAWADGGYYPWVGMICAAGWGAWKLRGQVALRTPVSAAALAGVLAWSGGTLLLQHLQHLQQGTALPGLALQDLHGREVAVAADDGRPLVINLWASWCGPCVREMPMLEQMQQANPQVRFLFVNQGEAEAEVRDFLAGHAPALQGVLLDPRANLSQALGVQAYPGTLFFSGDGQLQQLHLGELSRAGLDHKLRGLR